MNRRAQILPPSMAPIGLSREEAAAYIGVGASLFDRLISDGRMPQPRPLGERLIWDVAEVTAAFRALPHRDEVANQPASSNDFD